MRWSGRLVAILLVSATVVVVGGSVSVSVASQSAPIVLGLKFRPVVRLGPGGCYGAGLLSTSGHYALVSISSADPDVCISSFVLVDDRTGKRTVIHRSGFTSLLAFGAPWIYLLENGHGVLYNIDTKRTHRCGGRCVHVSDGVAVGYALGSRWLETFIQHGGSCGDGIHYGCGPVSEYFYNIKTGRVRYSSSTSSTKIVDLNSPRLFHRVCPPLQVPPGPFGGIVYGEPLFTPLAFYGSFAVATVLGNERWSWLLERCGSTLLMPIGMSSGPPSPPVASTHAVVWQVLDPLGGWHGQFVGILLPSLRPFTATVPSNLQTLGGPFALSAFRLYMVAKGRVWAATVPR